MADIRYPAFARDRGAGYWLRPRNLIASRQKLFRMDYSNEWRYAFGDPDPRIPPYRSVQISSLVSPKPDGSFRFVVLGDTGEGDCSQYGLLPLIRALHPDFMIINGDVAYPSGRTGSGNRDDDDFLAGFFEPYRNLGIPIWATPGNHEYYSPGNGREFNQIFCTRAFDGVWSHYGLPHSILQPGMYWELRDDASGTVVIGLDTGKKANLDGHNDWWQFWKRHIDPDRRQHDWLASRLRRAEERGDRVLLLFHIPALVNEKHEEEHLNSLHRIIASYSCVRLVLCGHEHNFQRYDATTFARYLSENQTGGASLRSRPEYIVAGSSGAALASTVFGKGTRYKSNPYPASAKWSEIAGLGRKTVDALGLEKTALGKIVSRIEVNAAEDGDAATWLTLILVDVLPPLGDNRMRIVVTPVQLDDLQSLFDHVPPTTPIDVTAANLPVNPTSLSACLTCQTPITL